MLKTNIKIAIRNFLNQKAYSFINIIGLSTGLACFFLIFLYVEYKLGYDKQLEDSESIYRLTTDMMWADGYIEETALSASAPAKVYHDIFPEIKAAVRMNSSGNILMEHNNIRFYEAGLLYSDSSFFDVFKYPLINGDPRKVLSEPYSLLVSQKMADKYFGEEPALGQTVKINNDKDWTVTGVFENIPGNTHLPFDFLASSATLDEFKSNNWMDIGLLTYFLLEKNTNSSELETKIQNYSIENLGNASEVFKNRLQKLTDIHLFNDRTYELAITSDINHIYLLSAVAILILIIACINYMNLSTARSTKRFMEVGVRKVNGANRLSLIRQFLIESFIISFLSLFFSIVIVETFISGFNNLLQTDIFLDYNNWIFRILGLVVIVALVSGSYPALYISGFRAVQIFQIKASGSKGNVFIRKALIVFQFGITITLFISTITIFRQLDYLKKTELGFDKELILSNWIWNEQNLKRGNLLKNELLQYPQIKSMCFANSQPGLYIGKDNFIPEDFSDPIPMYSIVTDFDFLRTMGLEIVEGRDYSSDFSTDSLAVIINETAARELGWENPLGKEIIWDVFRKNTKGEIIAVIKDFNYLSLHQKIEPLVIRAHEQKQPNMIIQLADNMNKTGTIELIEEIWNRFDPVYPFDFTFIEDDFNSLYTAEKQLSKILTWFTIITLIIACLGLFGLSAYMSERRNKEIGIRKVNGASVINIIILLTKQFGKWILISVLIAYPIAWIILNKWLNNFEYKVNISWLTFVLSTILALFIAFMTTSWQARKTAMRNPVDSLKYE